MARTQPSVINQKLSPKAWKSSLKDWFVLRNTCSVSVHRGTRFNRLSGDYYGKKTEVSYTLYALDTNRGYKTLTAAKRQANNLYCLPMLFSLLTNKTARKFTAYEINKYNLDAQGELDKV